MTLGTGLFKELLQDPQKFAKFLSGLRLRSYQQGVFEAVFRSVLHESGFSFVVMFPRQSGKNELQAHLEVYLMTLLSQQNFELIKVSPTLNPQALTSMHRFEKVARRNLLIKSFWKKEGENAYRVEEARITFLSGAKGSNVVGATASGLLEVDEAQQVKVEKFDRDIAPMAASTNATHVFWGTAWTRDTLLGRELRAAQEAEKADGQRRVFRLTAEDVYAEVDAYRKHVEAKIARFGRNHPMVRTQYFSEEVDSEGAMFTPERMARIRAGQTERLATPLVPKAGGRYALLLDVAGEDEGVRGLDGLMGMANPARDATAMTLVEVVVDGEEGAGVNPARTQPVYRVVRRWQWIGVGQPELQAQIREVALEWRVRVVVVDATGVGAGLASALDRALPGRVIPFTFSRASKSTLGWDFLGMVDADRWREPLLDDLPGDDQLKWQNEFFAQLAACRFEVANDAKHTMRWSVPDGTRSVQSGDLLHDDWVTSAALAAVLEKMDWHSATTSFIVQGRDPLEGVEGKF